MPREHSEFIDIVRARNALLGAAGLRGVIMGQGCSVEARDIFDRCVYALAEFRTAHLAIVARYIIAPQNQKMKRSNRSLSDAAGGKGTGGTALMQFLKPIRNATLAAKTSSLSAT